MDFDIYEYLHRMNPKDLDQTVYGMKFYTVRVITKLDEELFVDVQASSPDEAIDLAIQQVEQGRCSECGGIRSATIYY